MGCLVILKSCLKLATVNSAYGCSGLIMFLGLAVAGAFCFKVSLYSASTDFFLFE